jgi:hypothetical protein
VWRRPFSAFEFEIALYLLGRGVAAIFMPFFGVEPPIRRVWTEDRTYCWRGFFARVGDKRIITNEGLEIMGAVASIGLVAIGIAIRRS